MKKSSLAVLSFLLVLLVSLPVFFPREVLAFKYEELASPIPKGTFRITAYTNGLTETGKKPGDPYYGITASGTTATSNRTIAVDRNVIPLGSVVTIDGYSGVFVAEDTGSAIKGNDIDMFYANPADIKNYPNPHRNVTIVGKVDLKTLGGTMTGDGGGAGGTAGVKQAKDGEIVTTEFRQQIAQMKENSSILEKFMIGQAENLFNIGGINSLQNLVYGNPYTVWLDDPKEIEMLYGLFSQKEFDKIIEPMCAIFMGAYGIFVVLAIMLSALKLGVGALRPQARADFWKDINMWAFSAFFMSTFIWFSEILFGFNEGIVDAFESMVSQQGGDVKGVSIIAFAAGFSVGDIFVFLGEWVLALYMNIIYVARKIVIMFLMVLAPVAAISLLYARTRFFFSVWVKEYIGNIFLQSVHAIVLSTFALISAHTGAGMIFKLGMLIMFIPISGLLSKWLNMGDSSSMLGRTAAMTGLGSIASLGYMAKSMNDLRRGGRPMDGMNRGGIGSAGSDLANDSGQTGLSTLMSGVNSQGWGRLKRISGMIGMGTGAIAGSVLGPMGATVGGGFGKKVGEMAPQLARQVTVGSAKLLQGVGGLQKHAKNQTGNFVKDTISGAGEVWNDLSHRREALGKVGELVGGMVGMGAQGRALGQMMSGVSRNRLMEQEYGNRDLQAYAQQYPGANIQWRQDRNGSAFFREDEKGNWQQISPTGAADPSLKNNEERRVDFQLNNGSPWVRQENGSYTLGTTNPLFSANGRAAGIGRNVYGGGSLPSQMSNVTSSAAGIAGSVNENIAQQIMGSTVSAAAQQAPDVSAGGGSIVQGTTSNISTASTLETGGSATTPAALSTPGPASVNPSEGGSLAQIAGTNPSVTSGVGGNPITGGTTPGIQVAGGSASTPVSSGVPLAPAGTIGEIVSHQIPGHSSPVYDTRQVVGLEGSTAQLARKSGAYIVGAPDENGQQQRFEDTRMNAASINPDAYFAHNAQGRGDQRTTQDRMADVVHSVGVGTAQAWTRSTALVRPNRNRGVV
ncbi:3D domain-containing protein [Aneurinibacillus migulanus]|uniref:3D domain-containing protein n=1 Tax=Aneurinibacillus migulanus TaxID=47500 RepID=UPI002E2143F2|nr:3D domain-containing protein [Aneurinibacillus migulanus]MED4728333.1 3D domain-containing protein [Aneurinibacillus migulanus]